MLEWDIATQTGTGINSLSIHIQQKSVQQERQITVNCCTEFIMQKRWFLPCLHLEHNCVRKETRISNCAKLMHLFWKWSLQLKALTQQTPEWDGERVNSHKCEATYHVIAAAILFNCCMTLWTLLHMIQCVWDKVGDS